MEKRGVKYNMIHLASFIVASILFIHSCSSVEIPSIPTETEYPVSLSANPQQNTKVSLDGTSLSWESSDLLQITAVAADGSHAVSDLSVYSIDPINSNIASFSGFVTLVSEPQKCYFTYPSGDAMGVDVDNGKIVARFNNQNGAHKPFLYSVEDYSPDGITTEMKFAAAMLQISVEVEGVCSLAFFGNKFEDMYPLVIDPSNGSYTKSEETGYIIQVPVQSEGPTYICVPTVNLEDGFSIVLIDADGHQMVRSFSDGTTGGYDFSDKAGYIVPITISGEFERFGITCSLSSYEHTYIDALLSGTAVEFVMDKTGVPDARIQEWGATLVDSKGNIVRQFISTDGAALSGATTTMSVVNNYKLLPAGEYIFSPYYKSYDTKVTLGSETITIPDPGVEVTLNGYTSYDLYVAGEIEDANSRSNTLIYSVGAEINVHNSIIDSYTAMLDGESLTHTSWSGKTLNFGNKTKTAFKDYPYSITFTIGNLTFSAEKDFHITGLPMEVNFGNGDNTSWGRLNASYSDSRIEFPSSGESGLLSPAFHIPAGDGMTPLYVKTAFDGCGKNIDFWPFDSAEHLDIYITLCPSTQSSVVFGSECVRAHYKVPYSAGGYLSYSGPINLTTALPSLMYSARNTLYTKAIYKVKIEYTEP